MEKILRPLLYKERFVEQLILYEMAPGFSTKKSYDWLKTDLKSIEIKEVVVQFTNNFAPADKFVILNLGLKLDKQWDLFQIDNDKFDSFHSEDIPITLTQTDTVASKYAWREYPNDFMKYLLSGSTRQSEIKMKATSTTANPIVGFSVLFKIIYVAGE